jgi:hypothetical protein
MLRICWSLAERRQVKALLRLNKGDITALLRSFKTGTQQKEAS